MTILLSASTRRAGQTVAIAHYVQGAVSPRVLRVTS